MTTNTPLVTPGIASFASDGPYASPEYIMGDRPQITSTLEAVAQNTDLAFLTVVGRVANAVDGAITKAVQGSVTPIGVLAAAAKTGAGQTGKIAVFRTGHFNPNALVWDSSYDTAAKKAAAFEGAGSPTQILLTTPGYVL